MNKSEQKRFDELYHKHLRALKLQGMSDKTIDAYSRAVRRISAWLLLSGPVGAGAVGGILFRTRRVAFVVHGQTGSVRFAVFLQACAGTGLAVGQDDPGTEDQITAGYSERCRDRAIDWCCAQVALPGIRADDLFDGLAPGRDACAASRGYRCGPKAGAHSTRQGPQGSAGATSGSDLPGASCLVVEASTPTPSVSQGQWIDGDRPPGAVAYGSRRRADGHEEDAG